MKCQQPENYLKSIILLLGILMLHTCDKDFDIEEDHLQENNKTLFSDISFNTFKTNVVDRDLGAIAINNLISKETLDLGQLQYTTSSQDYVISIDSTKVLMAEKDGVTSYTFKVHTTDNSKTTNYVLALEDDKVAEFYITYESGSAKVVDPTTGYEVTTQSSGDAIWCPYAEVVEVCADCGSTSCNFDIWGSQFEIVIHYEPCRGDLGGGGSGGESGSNNPGEEEGDSGSGGSTNESSNDLPLDGRAITKELKDLDCPSNYNYYNRNSPFNVDLSTVIGCNDDTIDTSLVEANEKFMCIYNKLAQSPKFKDLFIDTFGESERLNVRFELDDTLPNSVGGVTGADPDNPSTMINGVLYMNLRIRMNKNHLDLSHISAESILEIAKNIIHECIHAFLYVKKYNCNDGTTIEELNNTLLGALINEYYDGSCNADQEQHEFMFDYMLPTMKGILNDVKDDLISQEHQAFAEEFVIVNEVLNINEPWSWDKCFKNISMSGLDSTSAFENEIANNTENYFIYNKYKILIEQNFSKNCN